MAVNYESKPKADPKTLGPSVDATTKFDPSVVDDNKTVAESPAKIEWEHVKDYANDPIFQALLVGVVTKHGIEHFSTTGKNTVQARVQTLIRATDNIKEHLG